MGKIIKYGEEARNGIKAGVDKLNNATKITLGGKGRNVLIRDTHGGGYQITKDGVTVAKAVELDDEMEDLGCEVIKKVSLKTNEEVGDGTTTSIVLAQAMMEEGIDLLNKEVNPIALKRGMDKATIAVVDYLDKIKVPVDGDTEFVKQIATISSNNDVVIGEIIAKAFEKVGKHGVIKIDQSSTNKHDIEHTTGIGFDRGYIHPIFTGSIDTDSVELENPFILITDYLIRDLSDLGTITGEDGNPTVALFEQVRKANRPLLIICEDMEIFPAQTLGKLMAQNSFISVVVKSPEFGNRRTDVLEDLAVVTGGTFITKEKAMKLSDVTIDMLGGCKNVYVDANNTSITEGEGEAEAIKSRVEVITEQLAKEDAEFAKSKLEERLAKLTGGIATIKIGANSEVELKEIKDRVEDALNATKAAIEEGVVAGGGIALFNAITSLRDVKCEDEDEEQGVKVISKALMSPLFTILVNAGDFDMRRIETIQDSDNVNYGYDVKSRKFVDMFKAGIIDPVKVTRTALMNSSSIASTLLTTGCVINNKNQGEEGDIIPHF